MEYVKKTAVLKQIEQGFSQNGKPIGGIARVEIEHDVCDFILSLINFCSCGGEYFAFLCDGNKKLFKFALGKKPSSLSHTFKSPVSIDGGFSVGIVVIENDIPLTVAFCRSDDNNTTLQDFKKSVANYLLNQRKSQPPPEPEKPKTPPLSEKTADCSPVLAQAYDDEAVATENYFDFNEQLDLPNEEKDYASSQPKNQSFNCRCQAQTTKTCADDLCADHQTSNSFCQVYSQHNPYYQSIKKEMNTLFLNFPKNQPLENAFQNATFVKIFYSNDKYYTVGVIREEGKEKYVCYGVPATYSPTPPKELEGFCSFIPLSIFDLKGDGYWMIFQDAVTGERIKPCK